MGADEHTVTLTGSSPRVRGTGRQIRLRDEENRFIPAGAGNGFYQLQVAL